jgi:hypothetical protein
VCIRVANFPPSLWFPFGQNFWDFSKFINELLVY